jgi:hypothetical protein
VLWDRIAALPLVIDGYTLERLDAAGYDRTTIQFRLAGAGEEGIGEDVGLFDENVRLQTSKVSYTYADPAIEDLPKVQRQFLRMGPQNVRIVKAKIRDVAGFLGLPESSLPPPDRPR